MYNAGLVHSNQLKPVLVQLKKHHLVLRASMVYDLKYVPFDYYNHYEPIKYLWAYRRKVPHNPVYK